MKANNLAKLASAIVLCIISATAQATLINGEIGFAGSMTPTGGKANAKPGTPGYSQQLFSTATGLNFLPGSVYVTKGTQSGDYIAVPDKFDVTYNNFTFSPFSSAVTPLWTFSYLGKTYSFDLETVSVETHTGSSLVLSGTGTLNITGFEATPGSWELTSNRSANSKNTSFSFSADNSVTAIPEPFELSLLGLGLAGLAVIKRKS